MKAVSSLLAGGPLSSPGIRLVTAGVVCFLWLLCFRSARPDEGACMCACVFNAELLSGWGVRQFLSGIS